jgi:LL-H family phage holin
MDQQLINNIVQVIVLIVGAVLAWFMRNSNQIKEAAKDNQAAQTTIDVINKVATYVVHELQTSNLDNAQKRKAAIDQITSTLHVLGLKDVSRDVIAGAVESAVSAMHLAWDKEAAVSIAPVNVTEKPVVPVANTSSSQQLTYYPDSQLAVDTNGATYTLTRLGDAVTKETVAKQEAGGGPINE